MDDIIKIDNLTKKIKGITLLDNLSFRLTEGEICAIVGRNGAGKTTLFKILSHQSFPTTGKILYLGKEGGLNLSIGTLIERPKFINNFTAFENLKYFSLQKDLKEDDKIEKILDLVDLPITNKKFVNFSLGMKQRLGIALALIYRPNLLILDEPVNGLDPEGIRSIRRLLTKINKEQGTTILMSSHILTELEAISDNYIFIEKGKMIEKLSNKELHKKLKNYVLISVCQVEKAISILNSDFPEIDYIAEGSKTIKIKNNLNRISQINKVFVDNEISVDGITNQKASLEDYFFELISRG